MLKPNQVALQKRHLPILATLVLSCLLAGPVSADLVVNFTLGDLAARATFGESNGNIKAKFIGEKFFGIAANATCSKKGFFRHDFILE